MSKAEIGRTSVALLADIHGNSVALDAVLADIASQGGADAFWVLGDLAAIGPDPIGVLERLSSLPNARLCRGNTDRYIVTGDRPSPSPDQVKANPSLVPTLVEVVSSFAWTQGAITAAGWLDWVAALPLEFRVTLPDGTRCLCVHASPGCDDGRGIAPNLSQAELETELADTDADMICVGHVHWPLDVMVKGIQVLNPGSVSNPVAPDLRASYAILTTDTSGYRIEHHGVEYDREAVIRALEQVNHPGADFVTRHMKGRQKPPWPNPSAEGTA
jgi:predicted phosphodiesterase